VAHFVRETVREGLDLRLIYLSYKGERGQPPSRPAIEGRGSVPITATWYKTAFADPLKDLSDPSIQDAMTLAYTGYGCLTYCRQHFLQIMVATELEFLGVN